MNNNKLGGPISNNILKRVKILYVTVCSHPHQLPKLRDLNVFVCNYTLFPCCLNFKRENSQQYRSFASAHIINFACYLVKKYMLSSGIQLEMSWFGMSWFENQKPLVNCVGSVSLSCLIDLWITKANYSTWLGTKFICPEYLLT